MDQGLQEQIEKYRAQLGFLIRRGRDLREMLAVNSSNTSVLEAARRWQQECGVVINELSGGSKAHWLARAFSEAFLLRSPNGEAVEEVSPVEITSRVTAVLELALQSISQQNAAVLAASSAVPAPHRFDFVHNAELRPVLEQAYNDATAALQQSDYDAALPTYSGILEAIVTDALEHRGAAATTGSEIPPGKVADWSFDTRLSVAEKLGLIRGGCARLPSIARQYRDSTDDSGRLAEPVSERDARITSQVLHVIMRDLNPSR